MSTMTLDEAISAAERCVNHVSAIVLQLALLDDFIAGQAAVLADAGLFDSPQVLSLAAANDARTSVQGQLVAARDVLMDLERALGALR